MMMTMILAINIWKGTWIPFFPSQFNVQYFLSNHQKMVTFKRKNYQQKNVPQIVINYNDSNTPNFVFCFYSILVY